MTTILGHGIYTFPEAARLIGLKQARVREWFRGHAKRTPPVFSSDYDPVDGDYAISFLDLIDVFVAGQLRQHGLSLQTLRRVYRRLEGELKTAHPFARQELLTDGKIVFSRGLDAEGQAEIIEILTRQKVFPQIIEPFLKKIDYDAATALARRWRINKQVIVDPAICLGKPVVEAAGVPTAILAAAYRANDKDAGLVADWYNLHPDQVLAAVRFEEKMAA